MNRGSLRNTVFGYGKRSTVYLNYLVAIKGQLISKANCQAVNSSENRTNEFVFLCDVFSFVFWIKLKTPKRHFEII
jgi:hypothetical protein